MGSVVEIGLAAAAGVANAAATTMKIGEQLGDYASEIKRMREMRDARLAEMQGASDRAKGIGIAGLEEKAAAGTYETRMATMKAEMASSSAVSKVGASGAKMTGSQAMAAQQQTDIAYLAADRTSEASAAGIRIGGLELGNTLQTQRGERTLLTLDYKQKLAEAKRKADELQKNAKAMVLLALAGGTIGALA